MKSFGSTWLVIFVVLVVVFWPWAIIWALNLLFGLSIAYTFSTWLAVLLLLGAARLK